MSTKDAELVKKVVSGQYSVFGQLVERHRDIVFGICFGRCGNQTDAQDLTQEAFIRAFTNLHQLRDAEKFAPWLYRITYAICNQWHKDQRNISYSIDEAIMPPVAENLVEDEVIRHETRALVSHVLNALPENQRLAATLHYFLGYSYDEIGKLTGVGASVIKTRLQRARTQLRNNLFDSLFADRKIEKPGKSLTRKILAGLASFEKEDIFSHIRALRVLLESRGHKVEWDWLLGVSGEAFCSYFSPSWTYLTRFTHTWDVLSAGSRSYGYEGKWSFDTTFDEALDIIEAKLKKGQPVAAPGIYPAVSKEGGSEGHFWFVVNGLDRKKELIYLLGTGDCVSAIGYPWAIRDSRKVNLWHGVVRCFDVYPYHIRAKNPLFWLVEKDSSTPLEDYSLNSLRKALALSEEAEFTFNDLEDDLIIYSGIQALDQWSKGIAEFKHATGEKYPIPLGVSGHYGPVMYSTSKRQEVSRRSASSYLNRLAETNPKLPHYELLEAANHFEISADLAHKLFETYFNPSEETAMLRAVAQYPKPQYYDCEEINTFWNTFNSLFFDSPQNRLRGVEIIRAITAEEQAAFQMIRKALSQLSDTSSESQKA